MAELSVDRLMEGYSLLSTAEQKEFDKRYRSHKSFNGAMQNLVKQFVKDKKEKQQNGRKRKTNNRP